MDNPNIARLLRQTADLMEVAGEDSFRIRSYRKAADVVDTCPEPVAQLCLEPKRLLALPGIGKTMADHISELVATGSLRLREELLARYRPEMLDLLQVSGLGPKTVALIWETYGAGTLAEVEALARAEKIRILPRLGARAEEKILRGILAHRELSGRFRRDHVDEVLDLYLPLLRALPGVDQVLCAGSYRRGRDTIGDLDILLTSPEFPAAGAAIAELLVRLPRIEQVLGQGETKVSLRLHGGLQVDIRLLPPASLGAALQYFTGSKQHNVHLRSRAQGMGLKLNEYGIFRESDQAVFSCLTEADLYRTLGLDFIPPELREDTGEIPAAELGATPGLPPLVELADIRGDLHMHTTATDGRFSIREMAAAAAACGYGYIAITDHSQALAMANGLDEARALEHLAAIRAAEREFQTEHPGFRIFAGIEVDILGDGCLDLSDDVLAQLDIVIGSIHSRFDQPSEETTARLLRAIANPHLSWLGHPTGRLLLRREPYRYDFEQVLAACAQHRVAMEINASPERLDLNDAHARRCGQLGVPIVINTDAHHTRHLANMRYGILTARRAWLTAPQILNTLPAAAFLARLRNHAPLSPAAAMARPF